MAKKKDTPEIVKLDDDVYFLEGASAVVEYSKNPIVPPRSPGYGSTTTRYDFSGKGKFWAPWYEDNLFPQKLTEVVFNNNIQPGILFTKSDFITGQDIITYYENVVNGKKEKQIVIDPQFEEFKEENDCNEYLQRASTDFVFFGNVFTEFIFSKYNKKVLRFNHLDASLCRSGLKNKKTGIVQTHYVSTAFKKNPKYDPKNPRYNNVVMVPAYDRLNPDKYPKCIMHCKRYVPGYPYYSPPEWVGNLNWIKLASEIPLWHYSGMKNGYNIRWHIEIPSSYFDKYEPKQRRQREEDMRLQLNKWLAGTENVGKAFVSKFGFNGNLPDGWKITAVKAELNDAAYAELFNQSNTAITSGNGLDPTLAGVETQGRLSTASDKRISYFIYIALKTPTPRKILLRPFYEAKRINGWDKRLKFGIEDTALTTLDVNPTGTQKVTSG